MRIGQDKLLNLKKKSCGARCSIHLDERKTSFFDLMVLFKVKAIKLGWSMRNVLFDLIDIGEELCAEKFLSKISTIKGGP